MERAKEAVVVNTGLLGVGTSEEQDWFKDISVFRAQKEKVVMMGLRWFFFLSCLFVGLM
jgi:hypothetical protein